MYIGSIKIDGIATLAPMAGATDRAFREICASFGAAYLTSEMISIKGIIYGDKKTIQLASHANCGKPFSIQLFGKDPDNFREATKIILNLKPDIIDINMGCPAPKIIKSGSGSALMTNPKLCGEIVKAVKTSCNIPVTVKIRSGFDDNNLNAVRVAQECELSGADAITIHARTAKQMYSGKADLDIIKSVVSSVKIPVIGNGDIENVSQAKLMTEYTKCHLVAIGRGALGNPWLFKEINLCKDSSHPFCKPSLQEKINIMKMHFAKAMKYKGESRAIKETKKHMAWYIKGIPGASTLRKEIFNIQNFSDFENISSKILNQKFFETFD